MKQTSTILDVTGLKPDEMTRVIAETLAGDYGQMAVNSIEAGAADLAYASARMAFRHYRDARRDWFGYVKDVWGGDCYTEPALLLVTEHVCSRCHGLKWIAWTAPNSAAHTPVSCPRCGGTGSEERQ